MNEVKTTHRVEVVPIELRPHPNADLLSIVSVYGFECVVATASWTGITKAAYLQPDAMVDVARPEFAFLAPQAKADGYAIIKAKKLRGVISFGCLFPVPDDIAIGDEVSERYGVRHYEPPIQIAKVAGPKGVNVEETEAGPPIFVPTYDLDPLQRHPHAIADGTPVYVTEKMDGSNARYLWDGERFWCGSRNQWKREYPLPPDPDKIREGLRAAGRDEEQVERIVASVGQRVKGRNAWWQALYETPALMDFLQAYPGATVFCELAGSTNLIKYGFDRNRLFAFDVYEDGQYWDSDDSFSLLDRRNVPIVPMVAGSPHVTIPYDFEAIKSMAEGQSLATDKVIREGIVVVPAKEQWLPKIGRVKFKMVSGSFLARFR